MSYECEINIDSYLECFGKLHTILDSNDCSNVFYVVILIDFVKDKDRIISGSVLLSNNSFTCLSGAHGSTSWLLLYQNKEECDYNLVQHILIHIVPCILLWGQAPSPSKHLFPQKVPRKLRIPLLRFVWAHHSDW